MKNKKGNWARLPHTWYRVTMGTEYWLPKPPSEAEAVYVAKNLFYKPDGCRDLHKNNEDCWSMLIVDGPDELIGQEITWFNRRPEDATDVPLEVAEDMVTHYNTYGRTIDEAELNIFDINPGLLEHPEFNGGIGSIGSSDPRLAAQLANQASDARAAANYGYVGGYGDNHADMAQMQQWSENQSPMGGYATDQYDDRGWVTTGESLAGGVPLRNQHDVNQHLGQTVQLPGGSGQVDINDMTFANRNNDEVFGTKKVSVSPGKDLPGWAKVGGLVAGLSAIAMALSGKKQQ